MSDGTEKRERRQFEPPPWETELFDELARKRAEESSAGASPEPATVRQAPVQPAVTAAEIAAGTKPEAASPPAAAPKSEARIAEAQVDAMLLSLAAEEPRLTHDWTIGLWVAAVLGLFGSGVVLYGLVAMTRGVALAAPDDKPAALMMGVLTGGVGAVLLGMAVWVGLRAWKRRGE